MQTPQPIHRTGHIGPVNISDRFVVHGGRSLTAATGLTTVRTGATGRGAATHAR